MKNIVIPETVEAYQADLMERAFPDPAITDNEFYQNMIGWVVDHKTPLLYDQTHPGEYANFSINFNWLLRRDYSETEFGPPDTIQSMYALHEFAHMTHWLPTRLGEISMNEYAEQFTSSEYRASNETEILLHYRIPDLRKMVFSGMTLAVDLLKQHNMPQPSSALLGKIRPLLIEHKDFDYLVGEDPAAQEQLARIKHYDGNREWAAGHYRKIRSSFMDSSLPLGIGLTDAEYEPTIEAYQPHLSQERYEANVVTNVRMGYGMCDLPVPTFTTFNDARQAAQELEERDALIRN